MSPSRSGRTAAPGTAARLSGWPEQRDHVLERRDQDAGDKSDDLASLGSVRSAAAELRAAHPRIDLLINNAGRPDLDGELLAHILLGSLQSEPVLRLLERGEVSRLAASLRVTAAGMLTAPAAS
ncbi:short chain dehydrogenase [Nonomuraea coxensis DSM 45129]|uniref:Short chain dehydrogenase n=1 Tax=Nonomuraea coxensis DSM 45129 TaxID=1122611 RepID=A0ABX8TVQ9_9ACTN|nr:hypothetical protein [Nonomuraea coxensis]QYC38776.1 short chain dehydrogenase [Nonomuraea coxensis DSM 45129]